MAADMKAAERRARVRVWARSRSDLVSVRHPQSIHVDELMGITHSSSSLVQQSVAAMNDLIEYVMDIDSICKPVLIIALMDDDHLNIAYPVTMRDIIENLHDLTTPELYLMDWTASIYLQVVEEYRYPLKSSLLGMHEETAYISYRCRHDAAVDAEAYLRDIVVEFYPLRYRTDALPDA